MAFIGARQSTTFVAGGVPSPHQPCRQFGLVRKGEMAAINGVFFAPTMALTTFVAGGVTSPHQPCRQFGLVRFAYRWIDLCAGRMAD